MNSRINSRWRSAPFVLAAILLATEGQAQAAEDSPPADDESVILVTAERRETALQKTPISVGVVGRSFIERQNIQQLVDLGGNTAGLVTPGATQNMQGLYIRGIGTADPGTFTAVAVYLDDVYIPRTFGNGLFDLPDLARVEVLRGPQGTLYGQNTSAGAVKIVTLDPGDVVIGSAQVRGGNHQAFQGNLYLSGPLGGGFSASIAATHRENDGYIRSIQFGKNLGRTNTDQARIKLRYNGGPAFDAVLAVDATSDHSTNAVGRPLNIPGVARYETRAGIYPQLDRMIGGASLRITSKLNDALTLKSVTAVRGFDDDPSTWDLDSEPAFKLGWTQSIRQRQYSQEFQLNGDFGRLTFTAGALGYRETFAFDRITVLGGRYSEIDSHLKVTNFAVFGQANYNLTDALRVTTGVRYNREKQDFANTSYGQDGLGNRTGQLYSVAGLHETTSKLTPRLAADYQWSDSVMSYVSWTKGQKSGGFNRAAGTLQIASIPVDPESVTAYEFGTKLHSADHVFSLNLATFYNQFRNYQANITNPVIDGQLVTGNVLVNAGKAKTYGVEVEASLRPIRSLELGLVGSLLKTEFTRFANPTGAANTDYAGNELPNAPRRVWGVNWVWTPEFGQQGEIRLNGAVRHLSSAYSDVANVELTKIRSQTYVDLGAAYTTDDGHWTVSVTAQNALDKGYAVSSGATPALGIRYEIYAPPRQVLVGVKYRL